MITAIRQVFTGDAEAISLLSAQLGYNMPVEKTADQINAVNNSDNDIAYVAVDGNKIAGWIHVFYTLRLECPSYCEIGGLVVDVAYRGQGIGKALIAYTKPWCRKKGCEILKVRSNVKRAEAHLFYQKSGFTGIKEQKVFGLALR